MLRHRLDPKIVPFAVMFLIMMLIELSITRKAESSVAYSKNGCYILNWTYLCLCSV